MTIFSNWLDMTDGIMNAIYLIIRRLVKDYINTFLGLILVK